MIPLFKSLIDLGFLVDVVVAEKNAIEDHSLIIPKLYSEFIKSKSLNNHYSLIIIRHLGTEFIKLSKKLNRQGSKVIFYDQLEYRRKKGFINLLKDYKFYFYLFFLIRAQMIITPVDTRSKSLSPKFRTKFFYFPMTQEVDILSNLQKNIRTPLKILMIGKLFQRRKNHHWFLSALESISDLKIEATIAGQSPESARISTGSSEYEYYYELKKRIEGINETRENISVKLMEDCSYASMSDLYKNNQIFLLPSSNEKFAISPLEAMSFGLIVLVSESSGSSTYISDQLNGFTFKEGDYSDFHSKASFIFNNYENLSHISVKAKGDIATMHSIQSLLETLRLIPEV